LQYVIAIPAPNMTVLNTGRFAGLLRGQCPETPHSLLWQARTETPPSFREKPADRQSMKTQRTESSQCFNVGRSTPRGITGNIAMGLPSLGGYQCSALNAGR
jgi:hypothetical protein